MPTFHINRSRALASLLQSRGWEPAKSNEFADFSMWYPASDILRQSRVGLFDVAITQILDDKLQMSRLLEEAGLEEFTPKTFDSLPSYLSYLKNTGNDVFCFLKFTHSAGGDGVYCVNSIQALFAKLSELEHTSGTAILQQGIQNPYLINNKKFKIRSYALVTHDWQYYIYDQIMVVLHDEEYSPNDTSDAVQLSPNFNENTTTLNRLSNLMGVDRQIRHITRETLSALQRKAKSIDHCGSYHLFGFDFMCDADSKTYLIEVNGYPGFERTDRVGQSISAKLMEDLRTLIIEPIISGTSPVHGSFSLL